MATKQLPDVETLRKLLDYDPETGLLTWKARDQADFIGTKKRTTAHLCRQWNSKHAGKLALSALTVWGYRRGRVLGQLIMAHRVVWAISKGAWPADQIDHINGNPADNRISNLRDVSGGENMKNQRAYKSNKTGTVGVYWHSSAAKWGAAISRNGKQIHLGCYDNIEDAISARKVAEVDEGYHKNHGR
jgi:hypothetical protein